jgi:hypothetical protein
MNAASYQEAQSIRVSQWAERLWERGTQDPAWTQIMREYVVNEFSKHNIARTNADIDCRTTLCRVTVQLPSRASNSILEQLSPLDKHELVAVQFDDRSQYFERYYYSPAGVTMHNIYKDKFR